MSALTQEQWLRDPYDEQIAAMIAHRDGLIAAATGPIPQRGSQEWMAADDATRTASYAQAEARAAVAHGREISNRMAAEHQDRVDRQEASRAISSGISSAEYDRHAAFVASGGRQGLERRRAEVGPLGRDAAASAAARGDPIREAVDRATQATKGAVEAERHDRHIAASESSSIAITDHEALTR
jgi:hypothetical protein